MKIYLPRYLGKTKDDEEFEEEAPAESFQLETILLVEDDVDVRSYLADVLRSLKYRVITAPNGQAALSILADNERRISLLLTDVVMPGMNGRELGRRAHEVRLPS